VAIKSLPGVFIGPSYLSTSELICIPTATMHLIVPVIPSLHFGLACNSMSFPQVQRMTRRRSTPRSDTGGAEYEYTTRVKGTWNLRLVNANNIYEYKQSQAGAFKQNRHHLGLFLPKASEMTGSNAHLGARAPNSREPRIMILGLFFWEKIQNCA